MTENLVFNRFRATSIAGRILTTLSDGKPKSAAQVARIAKSRSADNILAPGGWYAKLRNYGKRTRKFLLSKTEDGKLVLKARKTARA